jgi:predicted nucleotidyltransferase
MPHEDLIRQAAVQVPEADLREIVRRIVEAVDPEKIILFGSAARGEMGPDSDLDLLVVKSGEYHPLDASQKVYRMLPDLDISTDVIVATPQTLERYRDSFCLVFYPALREGKVIYERAAPTER